MTPPLSQREALGTGWDPTLGLYESQLAFAKADPGSGREMRDLVGKASGLNSGLCLDLQVCSLAFPKKGLSL